MVLMKGLSPAFTFKVAWVTVSQIQSLFWEYLKFHFVLLWSDSQKLDKMLAFPIWINSGFFFIIYIQMSMLKLIMRNLTVKRSCKDCWKAIFFLPPSSVISLFLSFFKWFGCCNVRQIVALCLLSTGGEVRRGSRTARHQINEVWKPRIRDAGSQVILCGDLT